MDIIRRGIRFIGRIISYPLCLFKLKKLNQNLNSDELINFSYNNFFGLIKPMQIKSELKQFLSIIEKEKPKRVLEIGTANGGTLFLISRTSHSEASIISLDLPGGIHGGGYPKWKIPLYNSFIKKGQKLYLIRADSHKNAAFEKVKALLGNEKLDLLFIDGDHTYEGVKKDFEMYSKLVKRKGIIVLHDIASHKKQSSCEVNKFWDEIKSKYLHQEFIENKLQGWAGIGIIKN